MSFDSEKLIRGTDVFFFYNIIERVENRTFNRIFIFEHMRFPMGAPPSPLLTRPHKLTEAHKTCFENKKIGAKEVKLLKLKAKKRAATSEHSILASGPNSSSGRKEEKTMNEDKVNVHRALTGEYITGTANMYTMFPLPYQQASVIGCLAYWVSAHAYV